MKNQNIGHLTTVNSGHPHRIEMFSVGYQLVGGIIPEDYQNKIKSFLNGIKDNKLTDNSTVYVTPLSELPSYKLKNYIGENKLNITELGIKVSEFCNIHFNSLFEYRYTEKMEKELDLIEENKSNWKIIVKTFINEVNKLLVVDAPKIEYKSLHCGILNKNALVLKDGPYGFYIEHKGSSISLQKFKSSEIIKE
jgi:hypothetical protein